MRIFLTGATGYIGSSVLDALVRAGHEVTAIVRNGERATRVSARGAQPIVGNLGDAASYRAALGYDAYVLAAWEKSARGPEIDRLAITSLLAAARQSRARCLIYTSGVWVLGQTREPATEEAPVNPTSHVTWRPTHEKQVLAGAGDGLRTIVVRPGIVYGGSRGIVAHMLRDASNGLVRVIGSGENHWPLVYDRDLGDLYARLVQRPDASGIFHANDEGDERVNHLVEAIGAQTAFRPEVRRMPIEEARKKMGTYADALALDQIVRSPRAKALGWTPSLHSVSGNIARLLEEWRDGREAA